MKFLLIGGPADGQWIETIERVETLNIVCPWEIKEPSKVITSGSVPSNLYRRASYHGQDGTTIVFFRIDGMTPSEAARLLMAHYFPKDAKP